MEEKNLKKFKISVTDIALFVVSLVFFIGMLTFLAPCGPKEDGSWMNCHWVGQALIWLSAAMLVIAVMHCIFSDAGIKTGLSLALLPVSVLSLILPGTFIGLCMMDTMRCHTVTKPGDLIFSIIIIILAVIDILKNKKKS